MKKLSENPNPPIQLWKQCPEGFEIVKSLSGTGIWACGECGVIHTGHESNARNCCLLKKCPCGAEISVHYSKCQTCLSKQYKTEREQKTKDNFDSAELVDNHTGWIYVEGYGSNEGFFPDEDELHDWIAGEDPSPEIPEFAFCCKVNKFKDDMLDATDILENALNDYHEDAIDQIDVESLQEVLDKWMANQDLESWDIDYSKKIKITK